MSLSDAATDVERKMDLQHFLDTHGLTADPFAYTNAEEEELLEQYFVPPPYFNSVRGESGSPKSTVVFAPRGGGKTAQRRILEEDSRRPESNYLCVLYDRFEPGSPTVDQHLEQICRRVLLGILVSLEIEGLPGTVLSKDDREFLTNEATLLDTVDAETFDALIRSLKSDTRKMGDWLRVHSGPVKGIIAGLLAKRGIELDPTLPWGPQMMKARESAPLSRLRRLIGVGQNFGFDSVYVLVDRLDETASTATNPTKAIELVAEMLLDLTVMELPGLAIKVFAWDLSQDRYHELGGRRDRIHEFNLSWNLEALSEMMSRRLGAYSHQSVTSLNDLTSDGVDFDLHRLTCYLAAGSPRDMIRLCARVVGEHLNDPRGTGRLGVDDVWQGVRVFSEEICDERAKKFLPDLMRLDTYRFTQNHVANDLLKISKQSTGAKVTEWRRTGMVDKITEVQDARFRPQHLYGIAHPMLAIALRPGMNCRDVLEFYSFECDHCYKVNFSDETSFRCSKCQSDLVSNSTPSLMSMAAVAT
jgi:hypothetical protein